MSEIVVVTGAGGHIGGNLARALLERGRTLRLVARHDTRAVEGLGAEIVRADVLDRDSLTRAFAGADVVYHLAANISVIGDRNGRVRAVNVEGPRNVVEACLRCGVRRLVHFSSIHAFAQRPLDEPLDEARGHVDGEAPAYDRSKAAGEREVLAGVARGLDAVIVNPTGVLGPCDFKPSRMGAVLLGIAQRKFIALIDGGFDWVDVRDVCAGAIAAEERGRRGGRYLLSGEWVALRTLGEWVAEVTGVRLPRFDSPMWLARVGAPFVQTWSQLTRSEPLYTSESLVALRANRTIRHAKATQELGYQPRPIRQTVEDSLRWFIEAGRLPRS
jgi:dihydroflavonol-4-reductase